MGQNKRRKVRGNLESPRSAPSLFFIISVCQLSFWSGCGMFAVVRPSLFSSMCLNVYQCLRLCLRHGKMMSQSLPRHAFQNSTRTIKLAGQVDVYLFDVDLSRQLFQVVVVIVLVVVVVVAVNSQ